MEISIGDKQKKSRSTLLNQSGQGVVEYILVLVVIVAMVFGGIYQLNDAFRSWANSYFGDYLACLLETGELPSVGGAPGDSGICNELFKPFSMAEGRPYSGGGSDSNRETEPSESRGRGFSERPQAGSGRTPYVRSGGGGGGGSSFNRSSSSSSSRGRTQTGSRRAADTNTGNTGISSGGLGRSSSRSLAANPQTGLAGGYYIDKNFDEREQRQSTTSVQRPSESNPREQRIRLKPKRAPTSTEVEDEPFTIGNFLRILIIAAIIIALVVLIGGQMLQIGKSMDD